MIHWKNNGIKYHSTNKEVLVKWIKNDVSDKDPYPLYIAMSSFRPYTNIIKLINSYIGTEWIIS